jgi:mercuric ion transport protein
MPVKAEIMDQNTKLIGTGVAGAVLSLLCCVTPVLALLLSAIGLTAFIAKLDYVLIPAFAAFIALVIFALVRRRRGCPAKTPQPN